MPNSRHSRPFLRSRSYHPKSNPFVPLCRVGAEGQSTDVHACLWATRLLSRDLTLSRGENAHWNVEEMYGGMLSVCNAILVMQAGQVRSNQVLWGLPCVLHKIGLERGFRTGTMSGWMSLSPLRDQVPYIGTGEYGRGKQCALFSPP